ncbi:MAG: hypothetical protein M3Z66_13490 [Chloroflexota bacterium]|nr:hypothetical protein [Chloroflexota bacterium]
MNHRTKQTLQRLFATAAIGIGAIQVSALQLSNALAQSAGTAPRAASHTGGRIARGIRAANPDLVSALHSSHTVVQAAGPARLLASQGGGSVAKGTRVGNSIVVDGAINSIVLIPAPGVAKRDFHPADDAQSVRDILSPPRLVHTLGSVTGCNVFPPCTVNLSADNLNAINPSGQQTDNIESQFSSSSYYDDCCNFSDVYKFRGSSNVVWNGGIPFNATNVQSTDSYQVTGAGISVILPGGLGFSGNSNTATWTGSQANTYEVYHSFYDAPIFQGTYMWNAYEWGNDTFQFGGSFYTVGSYDSVAI